MSTTNRVFVARLAGCAVFEPNGDRVGRVRDVVVVAPTGGRLPRVRGLVVELFARQRIFIPMARDVTLSYMFWK